MKRFTAIILCVMVFLAFCLPVSANTEENKGAQNAVKEYKDLSSDHWAYNSIMTVVGLGIMGGYPDGTFKPDAAVSRGEFATMMVLALKLNPVKPSNATYQDVRKDHWAYKYVEAAKYYLTGFRTSSGDYFKPGVPSVREDMAVALVKALDYSSETVSEDTLKDFSDYDRISPKLRKYVALAVKHNLMGGTVRDGVKSFGPLSTLTRAEAATLLKNVIREEKITFEEEKVTYDDSKTPGNSQDGSTTKRNAPVVTGKVEDGKIHLRWTPAAKTGFVYYKVVIAKEEDRPKYPENGYLYCITNINETYATIDSDAAYNGGDFGKYLKPGQKYYFSVTAVYEDEKLYGNAISLTCPPRD